MSSKPDQNDGIPTGTYYVIPLKTVEASKPCAYYQELRSDSGETRWKHIVGFPVILQSGNSPTVTIMLATASFVSQHAKDREDLYDSTAVLLAALVKTFYGGPDPNTYYPATSGTPEAEWQVVIHTAQEGRGAVVVFAIVEDGNVIKLVSSADPEIQNGVNAPPKR